MTTTGYLQREWNERRWYHGRRHWQGPNFWTLLSPKRRWQPWNAYRRTWQDYFVGQQVLRLEGFSRNEPSESGSFFIYFDINCSKLSFLTPADPSWRLTHRSPDRSSFTYQLLQTRSFLTGQQIVQLGTKVVGEMAPSVLRALQIHSSMNSVLSTQSVMVVHPPDRGRNRGREREEYRIREKDRMSLRRPELKSTPSCPSRCVTLGGCRIQAPPP